MRKKGMFFLVNILDGLSGKCCLLLKCSCSSIGIFYSLITCPIYRFCTDNKIIIPFFPINLLFFHGAGNDKNRSQVIWRRQGTTSPWHTLYILFSRIFIIIFIPGLNFLYNVFMHFIYDWPPYLHYFNSLKYIWSLYAFADKLFYLTFTNYFCCNRDVH